MGVEVFAKNPTVFTLEVGRMLLRSLPGFHALTPKRRDGACGRGIVIQTSIGHAVRTGCLLAESQLLLAELRTKPLESHIEILNNELVELSAL